VPEPIPTLQDLVDRRLATVLARDSKTNRITQIHITPEGHAALGHALRARGRAMTPTRDVPCPVCQVPAGEPCTQPTNTGRSPVKRLHSARYPEPEEATA
jgi:hypothetical protein